MTTEKRMRRSPQQARGQRRVSTILDAASDVFSEIGYEETTTNAIAIRANTSIGSLYQFFPNKNSILEALAQRYRVKLHELLAGGFAGAGSLQNSLTLLIDQVDHYYVDNPAFQPMFYASQSSKSLTRVANETGKILVDSVSRMFTDAVPSINSPEAEFYARVVVFMMRSLIPLSNAPDEPHRERVLPELKRMVFAYLASLEAFSDHAFTLNA